MGFHKKNKKFFSSSESFRVYSVFLTPLGYDKNTLISRKILNYAKTLPYFSIGYTKHKKMEK